MDEPDIIINGTPLTSAQAATVRVAISSLYMEMSEPNALGDDEHGQAMAKAYKARLVEVLALILRG